MEAHEEAFIRAFLVKRYRERCLAKRGIPRDDLWHALPSKLDERKLIELPSRLVVPEQIVSILRDVTSKNEGYCISGHSEYDGRSIQLDGLEDMEGTIVSVVPGEVAYYQGEFELPPFRGLLLAKPSARGRAAALLQA